MQERLVDERMMKTWRCLQMKMEVFFLTKTDMSVLGKSAAPMDVDVDDKGLRFTFMA